MKAVPDAGRQWRHWGGRAAVFLGFTAGVIVLLLWLAGKFEEKVPVAAGRRPALGAQRSRVRCSRVGRTRLPLVESAVGTIRAVHETSIGSKLLARVIEVNLKAGQKVQTGDVLMRLDDTDLRAKLQQAKAAVTAAEAVRAQAAADEKRLRPTGEVQGGQPAGIRKSGHGRCDPPRPNFAVRRRPSTKCRRRWIGPPSALRWTAWSSTRRSMWATW